MVKEWSWIWTVTAWHSWWQWSSSPLPTVTLNGVVSVGERPRVSTMRWWRKLWVLSPSIRMLIGWSSMMSVMRSVSGAKWPDRACRLSWAGGGSGRRSWDGDGGCDWIESSCSSSSSVTRRNREEAHLWPLEYFSSQWKHNPFSRRTASSSGVSRLKGMDGDGLQAGVGRRGGTEGAEGAREARELEAEMADWYVLQQESRIFSSWRRAYATA